jgi:hypothetical protein
MPIGKCPLCLLEKKLIKSHLAPAALYDLCRTPQSQPVVVTPEVVVQSSRQWQDYVLCGECDNSFSQLGESWVLPQLARSDGSFPFYGTLSRGSPELVEGNTALYAAAKNPDIDAAKLTHFAMGIFWKASVHSWSRERNASLIDLGKCGEEVRRFLREEGCFPERMALIVGVSPPPVMPTFNMPYLDSAEDFHSFLFHVPGINFALHVGNSLPTELKQTCFASHPPHPIVISRELARANLGFFKRAAAPAHKAKGLSRYMDEAEEFLNYSKKGK